MIVLTDVKIAMDVNTTTGSQNSGRRMRSRSSGRAGGIVAACASPFGATVVAAGASACSVDRSARDTDFTRFTPGGTSRRNGGRRARTGAGGRSGDVTGAAAEGQVPAASASVGLRVR